MATATTQFEPRAIDDQGWLRRLDPRLKIAWLVWTSTLCMLLDSTPALLSLFLLALITTSGLRLPARGWLALILLLLLTAWSTLLSQGLFYARYPRTVLVTLVPTFELGTWQLGPLEIYREGLVYGLKQSTRLLTVTVAGLVVCLSTSPDRLLAALAQLRVPGSLAFMTVAALRFLPLIVREAATVRRARWLRSGGAAARRRRRPWHRLRTEISLLLPLMAVLLRRAESLATSVATRGFDPAARRTFYPALRLRPVEGLALIVLLGTWLPIVAAKLLYGLYVADLYYAPWARGLYDVTRRWL